MCLDMAKNIYNIQFLQYTIFAIVEKLTTYASSVDVIS